MLPYDGMSYQLEPVHAPGKVLAKSGTVQNPTPMMWVEIWSAGKNMIIRTVRSSRECDGKSDPVSGNADGMGKRTSAEAHHRRWTGYVL